jgi:hypothetical protein
MCVMREDLGLLIISIRSLGAWRDAFDPAARQTIAESCATPQTRSIRMKSSSQNNFLLGVGAVRLRSDRAAHSRLVVNLSTHRMAAAPCLLQVIDDRSW